ncbi:MAG: hypothetical protein Q4C65_07660 [Eubacteriales bacterium]|nr:hypothetical protein [Eubacteriales bacterium]
MKKKTFIISIIAIIAAIGIAGWILGIRFAQTPKEESRVHSAETFLDEFFSFSEG